MAALLHVRLRSLPLLLQIIVFSGRALNVYRSLGAEKHMVVLLLYLVLTFCGCLGEGGKLRHSILEMYFLLGERCASYNGADVLYTENFFVCCQFSDTCEMEILQSVKPHLYWSFPPIISAFFLDRMTWMTQREV